MDGKSTPPKLSDGVYSVFNTTQFWDGRSPHLGDQAKGPMQAMLEMAITPKMAEERISSIPEYIAEFKKAFAQDKNPITFETYLATHCISPKYFIKIVAF
jgi:cytochrome c peroxidase